MAIANNGIQVQWSSADSVSVIAGANQTSDVFSFSASAFDAMVTVKADNSGTPASGDSVDLYYLPTAGDPDGSSADEYPADDMNGIFLARLDTYAEDPCVACLTIPVTKGGKLYAKSNAASNAITVSACINEKAAS